MDDPVSGTVAEVERWDTELDTPFRPTHEIESLAPDELTDGDEVGALGEDELAELDDGFEVEAVEDEGAEEGARLDEWAEPELPGAVPEQQIATLDELVAFEAGAGSGLADRVRGVAAFALGPALRNGDRGPAVAALQRGLISLGHDLAVDGVFGPNTERAVRAFQGRAGIGVDGVVGPQTKAAISRALAGGAAPSPTPTPAPTPAPTPGPSGTPTIPIPIPQACVAVPQLAEPTRACPTQRVTDFGGVSSIRTFAQGLADCASSRVAQLRASGKTVSRRATALADARHLESDFADTMFAAQHRWKTACRFDEIARGWMVGRREEVDFQTLGAGGRWIDMDGLVRSFAANTLEPMDVEPNKNSPVQPLLNRLLRELRARHPISRASNYSARHGGGAFTGRGFSVDLYIPGGRDERGFYRRDHAVGMLLALDAAAAATGVEWRVLYNDFGVAAAINRHTGLRHVAFVGSTRPGGTNLNWHGPLILHFHLDIAPKRG